MSQNIKPMSGLKPGFLLPSGSSVREADNKNQDTSKISGTKPFLPNLKTGFLLPSSMLSVSVSDRKPEVFPSAVDQKISFACDQRHPLEDYDVSFLKNASLKDLICFGTQYPLKHILYSPNVSLLEGNPDAYEPLFERLSSLVKESKRKAQEMIGHSLDSPIRKKKHLRGMIAVECAQACLKESVANCGDMCAAGALALLTFGCPNRYRITTHAFEGEIGNYDATHVILCITDKKTKEIWCGDPLLAKLNKEQREKITGKKSLETYWFRCKEGEERTNKDNAYKKLYVFLIDEDNAVKLPTYGSLTHQGYSLDTYPLFEFKRSKEGKIIAEDISSN